MSKEIIAIDVDEVLFPFIDEFIADHNNKYGSSLNKSNFDKYDFSEQLGTELSETMRRVFDFTQSLREKYVEPIVSARESIAKLVSKYTLVVITARQADFEEVTLNWVAEHFPDQFSEVRHIGYAPIMEVPLSKAQVCREIGAIALIDDSLEHVSKCTEIGVQGVLFGDYPWNKTSSLPHGVVRCVDWPTVDEFFAVQLITINKAFEIQIVSMSITSC